MKRSVVGLRLLEDHIPVGTVPDGEMQGMLVYFISESRYSRGHYLQDGSMMVLLLALSAAVLMEVWFIGCSQHLSTRYAMREYWPHPIKPKQHYHAMFSVYMATLCLIITTCILLKSSYCLHPDNVHAFTHVHTYAKDAALLKYIYIYIYLFFLLLFSAGVCLPVFMSYFL